MNEYALGPCGEREPEYGQNEEPYDVDEEH